MTVNPYKTMVGVIKMSVKHHRQRSRSIVCNSFKNKDLNKQINLTYMVISAIIVL
jgi:hypothetical protein